MNQVSAENKLSAAVLMAIAILFALSGPSIQATEGAELSWSQSTAYVPPADLGLPSRREPGGDR